MTRSIHMQFDLEKKSLIRVYRLIACCWALLVVAIMIQLLWETELNLSFEIIKGATVAAAFSVSLIYIYKNLNKHYTRREKAYTKLFKKNPHPMWVYDLKTLNFLSVNDAAIKFYGYSEDDFLKMTIKDIRPEEDVPAVISSTDAIRLSFNLGYHWSGIWRHKVKNGQLMYVEISSHEIIFEGRKAELVLAYDVTEKVTQDLKLQTLNNDLERQVLKRTQDLLQLNRKLVDQNKIIKSANLELYSITTQLKAANEKILEHADMKNRFIAMASHEFRTPLAAIKLNSSFIKRYVHRVSKEEVVQKVEGIEQNIRHMTGLLEDVLTIGKTDSLKVEMTPTHLNVRDFVDRISYEVQFATGNGSHHVMISIDNDVPVEIYADEKFLRNILTNLLTNAIKYSPGRNSVYFLATTKGGSICFQIKDEGLGIREGELTKIFEPFYRVESTTDVQGTGLGLAIVKRAADIIGATIEVESEIGKGTIFSVRMPL